MFTVRTRLRRIAMMRSLYRRYRLLLNWAEDRLPLPVRRVVRYYKAFGYLPNLSRPRTFNEKILYKLQRDRREIIRIFEDKYLTRQYAQEKWGDAVVFAKLHRHYENADDIREEDLPSEFVIKASCTSGWVKIYRRGAPRNLVQIRALARKWLETRFASDYEEWWSRRARQRVLVEELLLDDGELPHDYKFYCFDGTPRVLDVVINDFLGRRLASFDLSWKRLPYGENPWYPILRDLEPPRNFDKMCELARTVSRGHDFLRVDLYNIKGKIYLGELTNFPGHGLEPFVHDEEWGKFWTVPVRYE